jgi:predicted Rossmann fold flavoprotein
VSESPTSAQRDVDLAVIGAGAAGLMAAIYAGRESRDRGVPLDIVALDGARNIGAKILVSGGSRCNVTHDVVHPDDFNGSNRNLVARVLRTFGVRDTITFFAELGVHLKREETGKLFPITDRSRDVVEALLRAADEAAVEVRSGARIVDLAVGDDAVRLTTADGETFHARRVVLATGGLSLPKSGSDGLGYSFAKLFGHSTRTTTPALVPLLLPAEHWMTALSGIALEVELRLLATGGKLLRSERGSMLMTHFGLSGPVVLDISRHWLAAQPDAVLAVNFAPGATFDQIERELQETVLARPRLSLRGWLGEYFPERLAAALPAALGIDPETMLNQCSRDARRRLLHGLTAHIVPITGDRGYNFAEVTAGGVPLEEVETATMKSKFSDLLYLCGEVLDVDGKIGGYNFQWAWASGRLAGISAVRSLAGR